MNSFAPKKSPNSMYTLEKNYTRNFFRPNGKISPHLVTLHGSGNFDSAELKLKTTKSGCCKFSFL